MKKSLYDLTKDDWNTLFPVKLVEHDPAWSQVFENEKDRILDVLGHDIALRIEHFGSTSVPGIKAKPYIDILLEIPSALLFSEDVIGKLTALGYVYFKVPERDGIAEYMSFGKGYNLEGREEQIFHIHMCPEENMMWQQIHFRDYLRSNQERAISYEALKVSLESKFRNDRGAYVLGKTAFINETLQLAKAQHDQGTA